MSQVHRILTPKELEPAAAAYAYLCELVAEHHAGGPLNVDVGGGWAPRGQEQEDAAIAAYAWEREVTVERIGLVTDDEKTVGASPDGFVGEGGVVEIKVPSMLNHAQYLLAPYKESLWFAFAPLRTKKPRSLTVTLPSVAADHRLQVQGGLWLSGRDWCDVVSFNPGETPKEKGLPIVIERVQRDAEVITKIAAAVAVFNGQLNAALVEWKFEPPPEQEPK